MQANWQLPASIDMGATTLARSVNGRGPADAAKASSHTPAKAGFDYWLIYAICLGLFLGAGALRRLNPLQWRRPEAAGESGRESLFAEARAHAHHCATMSFQG